jgi:hypothetical protein
MLGLVRRKRWTPSGGVIESKNLARPDPTLSTPTASLTSKESPLSPPRFSLKNNFFNDISREARLNVG